MNTRIKAGQDLKLGPEGPADPKAMQVTTLFSKSDLRSADFIKQSGVMDDILRGVR
jgi:hypothetical protein